MRLTLIRCLLWPMQTFALVLLLTMAAPDGGQDVQASVDGVLRQLRAANLVVRKAPPAKPLDLSELDAMLAELDALPSA